jgi:predicted MPP superfamily phosphohydrolase
MSLMTWFRRRWIFLASFVLATVYMVFVEPAWIEVAHFTLSGDRQVGKIRVAQLSDIHLKDLGRTEENVLSALTSEAMDMIVLSGDIVDRPDSLPVLDAFLARLPKVAKVAVLGNWEYWGDVNIDALRETYARHDVKLLINECAIINIHDRKLHIVGLDDATAGRPDLHKVRSCLELQEETVLVQHSPGFFDSGRPVGKPSILNLSGHTHGGQISIFGWAPWTPPGSGHFNRGWYETSWGKLYVSRGIGTSIAPLRFASRPELALFEL